MFEKAQKFMQGKMLLNLVSACDNTFETALDLFLEILFYFIIFGKFYEMPDVFVIILFGILFNLKNKRL